MSDKKVSTAYLITLGVFAAQFIDVFFIHSENSVFADNIIARIVGIVLAVLAAKMLKFDLKEHCFKTFGWFFEVLHGIGFAVIPLAFVYILEYLYFRIKNYTDLPVNFEVPNISAYGVQKTMIIPILIYALTLLLSVTFKEMFFRGFLITQLSSKYGSVKTNIIQSVAYAALSFPVIIYSALTGRFQNAGLLMAIYMVIMYPLNNFICGIKWGYFYRVNGTIWMSIADHFFNNFLITCIYISADRLPEKWLAFEVFAVQIISCLMFIPFYIYRDNANMIIAEEEKIGMEVLKIDSSVFEKDVNDTVERNGIPDDVIPLRAIKPAGEVREIKPVKKPESKPTDEAKKFPRSDAVINEMMKEKAKKIKISKDNEPQPQEKNNNEEISSLVNQFLDNRLHQHK